MIGEQIIDFVYCPEGRHHVGRNEMTSINTANAGVKRRCCTDCKNRIIDMRKTAEKTKLGGKK